MKLSIAFQKIYSNHPDEERLEWYRTTKARFEKKEDSQRVAKGHQSKASN